MGAQGADHVGLRQLPPRPLRRHGQTANRYLTLYPGSPDAAYAQYLIGSSYFNQIPDITRDQDATRKAMASLQEIVDRYPDSEYANDAKHKIIVARDQLAGKEMQVGRYYLERREYIAAINRFKIVVTEYQDTRHVEEALERLAEANLALGLAGEAQTAAAVLGHNFPDSPWYKDAYKLLQTGGLEPRERQGVVDQQAVRRFPRRRAEPAPRPAHARRPCHPRHRHHRPAEHRFSAGMTVLTGETGAGKSILLDALSLALGGRGDASLVRAGAGQGDVTAVFDGCRRSSRPRAPRRERHRRRRAT